MFRALLERTDAPRVKLELARALYLQQRRLEARALFRTVLLDRALPWQVRDNIEAYLREIDEAEGYLRFSVSLVSDSNPRNITNQREFTIGGIRLSFVPPTDNEKVTGLRYTVQALQPVSPGGRLAAYFSGALADFTGSALDRSTIDAGLARDVGADGGTRIKAGIEAGTFGGSRLYDFPYVGLSQLLSQSATHRASGELKLGRVHFPDYRYLDAVHASMAASLERGLTPSVAMSAHASVEFSEAREKPYTYYGWALGPGLTWYLAEPAVALRTTLSYGIRRYAAVDPLFGEPRSDAKAGMEFSLRSKQWRWMNLRPALVLSFEENRSSIEFYGYKKANVSISME